MKREQSGAKQSKAKRNENEGGGRWEVGGGKEYNLREEMEGEWGEMRLLGRLLVGSFVVSCELATRW